MWKFRLAHITIYVAISQGFGFLESCAVMVSGQPTQGQMYERLVDPSCVNGTIDWQYPQGQLLITFQPSLPSSSVCLWHGVGPPSQAVYDITFNGPKRVTDPTQTQVSCVDIKDGKVVIRFDEPAFLTYMTAYEYRIIPDGV